MQGRYTQSYVGNFSNGNDHIARQCTQPTKVQNFAWFNKKMMLAQVQEAMTDLSKEQLAILADTRDRVDSHLGAYKVTTNAIFQLDGIDLYDSDCDEVSTVQASFMASLSSYSSNVLSEKPHSETYQNDMANQSVQAMQNFEQTLVVDFPDNEITIKDFENGLLNELNEVKTMYNQMEATVDQCSVDKKLFEIEKKELKLKNECLLEHIICQDVVNIVMHDDDKSLLVSQDLVHTAVNFLAAINDYKSMEKSYVEAYNQCLELEIELSKRNNMIEQDDAPEFHEFFIINDLEAQLQAKDTTINNLKKHIQELKGKSVADCRESVNKPKVSTPAVLKIDLEPLSSKLKNNREAHVDYIRITKENADTLRDIVEQAKTSNPLDNALAYACMYTKQIQELLVIHVTVPHLEVRSWLLLHQ
ncbi:hypothetical protein Tco_0344672 [Tanacetum coccineum]